MLLMLSLSKLHVFTAQRYTSAVYDVVVSVCPSVTSRFCTKMEMAKRKTAPHDNPGALVFWCQRSQRNLKGSFLTGVPNRGGVGSNGDFRPVSCCISETVLDSDINTIEG